MCVCVCGVGVCGCVCARALINNTFSLRRSTLKSHSARPGSDTDDVRESMQLPDIVSFWNLKELLLLLTLHCCLRLLSLNWSGHCVPVVAALAGSRDRGNITHGVVGRAARNCLCAAEATESGKKLEERSSNRPAPLCLGQIMTEW